MTIQAYTLRDLQVTDLAAFRRVPLYASLAEILTRANYPFRVLEGKKRWPLALLLNLTYWGRDGDLLAERKIPADVVMHAAWHFLANRAFSQKAGKPPTVDALFMGEAIASAFDAYLTGHLLVHSPNAQFLASQVPQMAETAESVGLSQRNFESLLRGMARRPEESFEELRALLYDATFALYRASDNESAADALSSFASRSFYPLLHRYELSNWVLYAKAYGRKIRDPRVAAMDRQLRRSQLPLNVLTKAWVAPALNRSTFN